MTTIKTTRTKVAATKMTTTQTIIMKTNTTKKSTINMTTTIINNIISIKLIVYFLALAIVSAHLEKLSVFPYAKNQYVLN